jgi:transposase-like protein
MNSSRYGHDAAGQPGAAGVSTKPVACPACQSRSITTTARTPDQNSYWRCDGCGEVWNASRRDVRRHGAHSWR